jgi:hypothetical protein
LTGRILSVPRLPRRFGPLGVALTLYDLYRRLPPKQRKQVLQFTRKHGPRIARAAFERGRAARATRSRPR